MTHSWPIRVYYEDVDLAGIVYYANYLRYIERARSEMVREAGVDQVAMRRNGIVFAVSRVEADYLKPAHYDDNLVVETRLTRMTPARFDMEQVVKRDQTVVFRAAVTIVCMDLKGRPTRLPVVVSQMAQ
ncbi:acyl-CoA thioester hydrolase [Jannaschia faecimaris]|uniref:Acyl-CoA thioester hydrolase n=1 Tax=Jannaschia faecimaris TaxID=1244108 RepID=A0A1H3L6Y5_9RHOB|nr:tol-pal system-associated acyl-CoA thioesterase [Jannaschia faecimaris]SDY60141.1 acyl-CoA thioester hydrolase [Jannaschia faecimaris]